MNPVAGRRPWLHQVFVALVFATGALALLDAVGLPGEEPAAKTAD